MSFTICADSSEVAMRSNTRKCAIQDFPSDIRKQIQRHVSSAERVIVCYETKREGVAEIYTYHSFQVLTDKQMVMVLRDVKGKHEDIVSTQLNDITNIHEGGGNSDYRVEGDEHGNFRMEFYFAKRQMAQEFSDILRRAIEQAKNLSVAVPTQPTQKEQVLDLIRRLEQLKQSGAITDQEFQQKKTELLRRI
ncbi:MAG: SHOCT domain-containing protein [Chloroflexi bacterium]|nr:SHOCT domain-containing protein [Chloroflexota bacterium]